MSKKLRRRWLYIAPGIKGKIINNGEYIVYDELTGADLNPTHIGDKIIIYERQVNGWFLDCATKLKRDKNAEFVVLMIATSYIEGVQRYIEGRLSERNNGPCFKRGLKRIFGLNETELESFYKHVRCGLFHTGMTKDKVVIRNSLKQIISFPDDDTIEINQNKFIDKIKKDFQTYIEKLKNPEEKELRRNFERIFSVI